MVLPEFPGSKTGIRRTISAPDITFDVTSAGDIASEWFPPLVSGNPEDYLFEDVMTTSDSYPGSAIGYSGNSALAAVDSRVPGAVSSVSSGGGGLPGGGPGSSGGGGSGGGSGGSSGGGSGGASGGGGAGGSSGDTKMGGFTKGVEQAKMRRMVIDPFTGKRKMSLVKVVSKDQRSGETVYREGITIDLGDLG